VTALITRAELDIYTNSTLATQYPAEWLDELIQIVSDDVEDYCVPFSADDVVLKEVRPWWSLDELVFRLDGPILALSGAYWSWTNDHSTTALDISTARVDYETGYVYVPGIKVYPYSWATLSTLLDTAVARLLVSYRMGYETVPSRVKLAVALLVQEQIQSNKNTVMGRPGPLQSFKSGSYSESYATANIKRDDSLGLGTELSRRARGFLKTYRGPGVAVVGSRP
jgi:hypothetical protein